MALSNARPWQSDVLMTAWAVIPVWSAWEPKVVEPCNYRHIFVGSIVLSQINLSTFLPPFFHISAAHIQFCLLTSQFLLFMMFMSLFFLFVYPFPTFLPLSLAHVFGTPWRGEEQIEVHVPIPSPPHHQAGRVVRVAFLSWNIVRTVDGCEILHQLVTMKGTCDPSTKWCRISQQSTAVGTCSNGFNEYFK